MSSLKVILLNDFDCEKVSIGKVKDNRSGMGKSANMSYEDGRFYLAITDSRFPFGASAKKEEYRKGAKDQWTLQCELTTEQIDILKKLDDRIIDECLKNQDVVASLVPKGKKVTKEVLESKYFSILKYSKTDGKINERYPPTIRVAIPNDADDGFSCTFFSSVSGDSEQIKVNNTVGDRDNIGGFLSSGMKGSVLVGMSLWVTNTSFGVTLRANQIKAQPREAVSRDVCLLDLLDNPRGSTPPP